MFSFKDERDGDDGGFVDSLEDESSDDAENQQQQEQDNHEIKEKKDNEEHASEEPKEESNYLFFKAINPQNISVVPAWKTRLNVLKKVVSTSLNEDEPPMKKKRADSTR